jgi:uncharacterized membrane protein HdeD (DUF308 family)
MSGGRAALLMLAGLASIIFGVMIAAQPASGLLTMVWLIGLYAIVVGIDFLLKVFHCLHITITSIYHFF